MAKTSNAQRALFSVLITALIAPAVAAAAALAIWLTGALLGVQLLPLAGERADAVALGAFVWSALPAIVAALALTPYVLRDGTYGWLHAAVAGVVAFGAAAIIFPFGGGPVMPAMAFLAGLIAILVRSILIGVRILRG